MNKKELIVAAAAASGLSQKDVEKALKAINEAIVAEVAKKGKVQLIGFGTFEANGSGFQSWQGFQRSC